MSDVPDPVWTRQEVVSTIIRQMIDGAARPFWRVVEVSEGYSRPETTIVFAAGLSSAGSRRINVTVYVEEGDDV